MTNGSFHGTDCFEVESFLQRNENSKLFKVRRKTDGEFFTMEVVSRTTNAGKTNPQLQRNPSEHLSKFLMNLRYAFQTQSKLYFILDYNGHKSLDSIYKTQGCFQESDVRIFASEIVLALQDLHQLSLSYGELSLERVIVDVSGHAVLWRNFYGKKYWSQKECICNFPSMIKGNVCGNKHEVSSSDDMIQDWRSLGGLIYRMLTGQDLTALFNNDKKIDTKNMMQSLSLPSTLSASVQDLIKRLSCGLLNSSEQVKGHPFFRNTNWTQVRSRNNCSTAKTYDGYPTSRTNLPSSRSSTGIIDNLTSQCSQQNSYSTQCSSNRTCDNKNSNCFFEKVRLKDPQGKSLDYKSRNEQLTSSYSFGKMLRASSSTPDISEIGLDQGSFKCFYTTLPHDGDSSYRHFDFGVRDQNNNRASTGVCHWPRRRDSFQTDSPNVLDYEKTRKPWNTTPSHMLRERSSSLTELNSETGFCQDEQYAPTRRQSKDLPHHATLDHDLCESMFPSKVTSNKRYSSSSSVSDLVNNGSEENLVSPHFLRAQEAAIPFIQRRGSSPGHLSGCLCQESKLSQSWQEKVSSNFWPTRRSSESRNFSSDEVEISENRDWPNSDGFGADLEGKRSRSSTVRSLSCTDIDLFDDDTEVPKLERFKGGNDTPPSFSDSRLKYPRAKIPIPTFEEFKYLRRQSTPGGIAVSDACTSRSVGFYRGNTEPTISGISSNTFPPAQTRLSRLNSGSREELQYSTIYQSIQDVAGRNTDAMENSSLFSRDTSTTVMEKQRPKLRKDFKSSPVLVQSSLENSDNPKSGSTPINLSNSLENEFSYFSGNEVIHKLMLKYGLYNRNSKKSDGSFPSETIQRDGMKESIHQDSKLNTDKLYAIGSKHGGGNQLVSNEVSRGPKSSVMGAENEEDASHGKRNFTRQVSETGNAAETNSRINQTAETIMIQNNKKLASDTNRDGVNKENEGFDYLSIRRSSVKDFYSSFRKSPKGEELNYSVSKNIQKDENETTKDEIPKHSKMNGLHQQLLQDEAAVTDNVQNHLDKPEKSNNNGRPSFYRISRSSLLASKFALSLGKKAKQNKNDCQNENSTKSSAMSNKVGKAEETPELKRSPSVSSTDTVGSPSVSSTNTVGSPSVSSTNIVDSDRINHPVLGKAHNAALSSSQSELSTADMNSLFFDANHSGLRRRSFHSSTLSISSIYSTCSSETEDNVSELGDRDLMMQEYVRKRGDRKSRWDSFHSNISADSGSCHMFEFEDEADSVAKEFDDDIAEQKRAEALNEERKSEADIERADSGYGGDISPGKTPKRRLEEIVEGSSKHWSVVAASAKHWQEVAKQRRMDRKGSPLRSPKRSPVKDDTVVCPDCLKHFVPDVKENSLNKNIRNPRKSALICSKCKDRHVERKEAIIELMQTETNYGTDLLILKEEFYLPMQSGGILNPEYLAAIFLNLQELLEVNGKFKARLQKGLEESVAKGDEEFAELNVGKAFLNSVEFFQAYEIYCSKQNSAASLLESLQKKSELLKIFLNVTCRENPKCRKMDLNSFLLAPVQRIMKYPMLLSRIRKATPRWNTDREKLKMAQRKIEEQLSRINALNTTVESKQRKYRGSGHLGRSDSLDKLQMKKMAGEILNWSIGEMQLLMHGVFQVAIYEFASSSSWNRRGSKKALDVYVLFCIRGHNEPIKVDSEDDGDYEERPLFPGEGDITDACLVLLKKKLNGKYTLFKDPLSLDTCVVYRDSDHKDTFELINMNRETYLFKGDTSKNCRRWLKFLRLSAKDLGNWKRRRNGHPNIMIKNL